MEKLLMSFLNVLLVFAVAISGFACGVSNNEDTENGSLDATAPIILGITVSDITEITVTISWDTDELATSDVVYGLTTSYGSLSPVLTDTIADKTSHSVALSELSPSTTYHYQVESQDATGNEAVSADFTFTTSANIVDTTAPVISSVASSSITQTSAIITWATDESATDDVAYGLTASYGSSSPVQSDTIADNTSHSAVLIGLSPNITYHYQVKSEDASGNEAVSADNTFTTLAETADTTAPVISSVASSSITQISATITWNTNELGTSNIVYSLTTSYGSSLPLPADTTADKTSHSVVLIGLSPNTTYHYKVKSKDAIGNEAVSADNTFTTLSASVISKGVLSVQFIDVGQGDAILIDKGDIEVLIDGGYPSSGVIEYLLDYVDGPLEVMVATHMHDDHAGGLIAVLNTFTVLNIWHNGDTNTTPTYNAFMAAVNAEGAQIHTAARGEQISVGELVFDILSPVAFSDDSNNNSIVLAFSYGNIDFLFTGDAQQEAESSMLAAGLVSEVEILKVGHHGSNTASSASFLAAASPEVAIYMAGVDHDYGHPHTETIVKLNNIGATVYGTDVYGTIIVATDGITYSTTHSITGVTIKKIDLENEIVYIVNGGSRAVDMTGWRLKSVTGSQTYPFPSFTLAAGATVRIVSGSGSVANPPAQLKWTGSYIWNNDGDPGELYDSSGNLVSSYP